MKNVYQAVLTDGTRETRVFVRAENLKLALQYLEEEFPHLVIINITLEQDVQII